MALAGQQSTILCDRVDENRYGHCDEAEKEKRPEVQHLPGQQLIEKQDERTACDGPNNQIPRAHRSTER
jgi:hypothetical protein